MTPHFPVKDLFDELKDIHNKIWDLEWQLKPGVENQIAKLLNCPVKEIKREQLSQ